MSVIVASLFSIVMSIVPGFDPGWESSIFQGLSSANLKMDLCFLYVDKNFRSDDVKLVVPCRSVYMLLGQCKISQTSVNILFKYIDQNL